LKAPKIPKPFVVRSESAEFDVFKAPKLPKVEGLKLPKEPKLPKVCPTPPREIDKKAEIN
jgi:hypothetical protein